MLKLVVQIEFDPAKDGVNIAKHGVSLLRAGDMEVLARLVDVRFEERRLRAYGLIDGAMFCLAYTLCSGRLRAVSFRRTHWKEYRRYVQ
jgi:uncharacterized DUF497 family protein